MFLKHQLRKKKRKFSRNRPFIHLSLFALNLCCYFSYIFAEGKTDNNDLLTRPVLCISVILKSMLFVYQAVIYNSLLI